jgi:hypothetical protein
VSLEIVNPESLGAPKGWNNGMLAPSGGRLLFVAGQAGWENDAAKRGGRASASTTRRWRSWR